MRKTLLTATMLACLALTGCGAEKVDLVDYFTLEFTGGEGIGVAEISFDTSEIYTLLDDSGEFSSSKINSIIDSIELDVDQIDQLSNGDQVTVTFTWDDELLEDSDFKFSGEKQVYTVAELNARTPIDFFSDLEIILDGISPMCSVLLRNTSTDPLMQTISYAADVNTAANGDTVTVYARYNNNDFDPNLYILGESEKQFTVSGGDEYITSYNLLDDQSLVRLNTHASDLVTTYLSNSNNYNKLFHNSTYVSGLDTSSINIISNKITDSYFATFKTGLTMDRNDSYSTAYIIFEVVSTDNKLDGEKTAYIIVSCKNFILRNSGETYFDIASVAVTHTYTDYLTMKAAIVDSSKAKYEFEEVTFKTDDQLKEELEAASKPPVETETPDQQDETDETAESDSGEETDSTEVLDENETDDADTENQEDAETPAD